MHYNEWKRSTNEYIVGQKVTDRYNCVIFLESSPDIANAINKRILFDRLKAWLITINFIHNVVTNYYRRLPTDFLTTIANEKFSFEVSEAFNKIHSWNCGPTKDFLYTHRQMECRL